MGAKRPFWKKGAIIHHLKVVHARPVCVRRIHERLSVSDIVAIKQRGVVSYHYVDSIGYKELPAFMKSENYLKNAEMQMEDDYGMIDGVINNGFREAEKPVAKPEETKLKKPSVLAKLRQYQAEDRKEKTMQQYAERDL